MNGIFLHKQVTTPNLLVPKHRQDSLAAVITLLCITAAEHVHVWTTASLLLTALTNHIKTVSIIFPRSCPILPKMLKT